MARKKKRYVGPTKEALKLGLASGPNAKLNDTKNLTPAEQQASYVQAPAPKTHTPGLGASSPGGMVADVQPTSPDNLDVALAGATLAENNPGAVPTTNLASYGNPQTDVEKRARAITLGYYKATHKYPSADKVMMLMQSPIRGDDPEVYARAWRGAESLPKELAASDFLQDTGYQNLHGVDDIVSAVREKQMGVEYSLPSGGALSVDAVKANMRYIKGMKTRYNRSVHDILNEAQPTDEFRSFSDTLANRLRRRGAPVLWDTDAPEGDKDFLKASTKYATGRQWAFSLWGSNKEKKTSLETIEYLRGLPLTKSQQQQLAENLGVEGSQWGDQNTVGTVLDAMRYADDDFVHKVVYDGWMFGRPVGQSPSQARAEYASRFGIQRLPADERAKYEQGNATVMGALNNATKYATDVWKQAEEIPGVGHYVLAPLGWFAGNTFKAFNYPIEAAMQSLVACYDMANRADRGMSLAQYHDYLAKHDGEDPEFGWNWSVFTDTAAWASAWEESEGKTPISEFATTVSLDLTGKETPVAHAIGQLADFAVMMYVGAKMDPVVTGAVKGTYVNAVFPAGRAAEAYIKSARLRYGGEAVQTGEWVLRVKKSDLDGLQPHVRAEYERLAAEYRDIETEAQSGQAPATTSRDAEVYRFIKDSGGIDMDAGGTTAHIDSTLTPKEVVTTFKGLGRRGKGQALDAIAQEIADTYPDSGITDGDSLFQWLNDRRTGKPSGKRGVNAGQKAADRASEIEGRVAYMLSNNRLPEEEGLMNAPEGMFDTGDYIGEGQQAGLNIGVDETAGFTDPFARPPEKGAAPMPGQESIPDAGVPTSPKTGRYAVGDKVRVTDSADFDAGLNKERTATVKEINVLPDGTVEYNVGGDQPWRSEVDILGPERRTAPREAAPATETPLSDASGAPLTQTGGQQRWALSGVKTNDAGVKVVEVTGPEGSFTADASIADDMRRLNEGGYPTHQSHGLPEDHPRLHPTQQENVKPYVEFVIRDLDPVAKLRSRKIADITEAAKKTDDTVVERGTAQVETTGGLKDVPTLKVKGDVAGFTENLMKNRDLGERPGPRLSGGEPEGPSSRPPADWSPQPRTPLSNAIFRTNAEVITQVDDPSVIGWMYDIPESDLRLKTILYKLAETKNLDETTRLLGELETHGIEIDGGAAAVLKNMRQSAYRRGIGYRTPILRGFITPMTYGKAHPVEGSSDMAFNVASAVKLGRETVDRPTWERIRAYRRRMWEADRPMEKQNVLNEMWDEIRANMGEKEWERFQTYKRQWFWASGRSVLASSRRAYLGKFKDGMPTEASKTASKARTLRQVNEDMKRAEQELDAILGDTDLVTLAEKELAVKVARSKVERMTKAWEDIDELGMKDPESLSRKDLQRLNAAMDEVDKHPVPFKMGQAKKHLVHAENPRILAWYQSGISGRAWGLVDQAVADPLMTIFKETVMSTLGFPLRVNVGDEMVRLIPEGTVSRLRSVRKMKKELKAEGMVGDDLRAELHDRLNYDWAAQDMGDWVMATKATHPRYFQYLKADLDSWKREPIVQRIIAENGGVFPSDVEGVHAFILRMAREDSETGQQMRQFLMDTYRYEGGEINTAQFREWADLWEERLTHIAGNETLRRSMTKDVTPGELSHLPDEVLWPVNAPAEALKGYNMSPATVIRAANRLNPFHYIYQGIPIPKSGGVRVGTVQMLGGISNWMRDTVFADRYYLERERMRRLNPDMDAAEVHEIATERAYRHTNRVTYSKSATVAEDMLRNLLPFVNAYRQFWVYWGKTFLKHPVSISVARENYPINDLFVSRGDLQAFLPAVPFWGINQNEDAEDKHGLIGFAKGQLPQASFLLTGPARTVAGALNTDPEALAGLPFLSSMSVKRAPFSRQGRIFYGLTGFNSWDEVGGMTFLFGDPEKLNKAHANAVLGQLQYGAGKTGSEVQRNKPIWWRAMEDLADALPFLNRDDIKPEALFAEIIGKQVFPMTTSYSPEQTRERANLLYEYYDAVDKGQTAKAAQLRASSEWLDTDLRYYDASSQEQLAMKKDPANAEHLKYWVSPYNYDISGNTLNGYDWQTQRKLGLVNYKSEAELEAAVHNLYTDIYGGTYVPSVGGTGAQREGGTQWMGDVPLAKVQKNAKAKLREALTWGKAESKALAKQYGWSEETLFYQFQHPSENWSIWPQVLKKQGKDPVAYNVDAIAQVLDKHPKQQAQTLSGEDAMRLLDLTRFIARPAFAAQMRTETPYRKDLATSEKAYRDEVIKAAVQAVGTENWFWLGSQQFRAVGIKASPKLDAIQLDLNRDYVAFKKLTVGSDEYKAARKAYYAKREKLLKNVPGGPLIYGGTAERIMALPYAMDAQVTSMGTGKGAVQLQVNYDNFVKVRDRELARDDPNSDHIKVAWDRFVAQKGYDEPQAKELTRVAAWALMLAESKHLRYEMMNHYSDYYEGEGESSSSKYGTARVDSLNKAVERLRKWSPEFGAQLNAWFEISDGDSVGNRFLDWYTY